MILIKDEIKSFHDMRDIKGYDFAFLNYMTLIKDIIKSFHDMKDIKRFGLIFLNYMISKDMI